MAFLDEVMTAQIDARAREVEFRRVALTLIAFPFYVAGWLASALWLAVCWAGVASKVGFTEHRKRRLRRG